MMRKWKIENGWIVVENGDTLLATGVNCADCGAWITDEDRQFIVDACNEKEARMCDCPTPTAYGCSSVIVDAPPPEKEVREAAKTRPEFFDDWHQSLAR